MNKCVALVPVIDETAEFCKFERRTDERRAREARQRHEVEARISEAERRRRKEIRRLLRRVRSCIMGIVATFCGFCSVLLWNAENPLPAVFPALFAVIAIWVGVKK